MAVSITATELMSALRVTDTGETTEITRLLGVCSAVVVRYAPKAPEVLQNEAVIRMAGYLYDKPTSSRGTSFANAFKNSGAAVILLPYRVHRAGTTDSETDSSDSGGGFLEFE